MILLFNASGFCQGISKVHAVNGNNMFPPFPEGSKSVIFGMGCFWGVERNFWKIKGVHSTQVSIPWTLDNSPRFSILPKKQFDLKLL